MWRQYFSNTFSPRCTSAFRSRVRSLCPNCFSTSIFVRDDSRVKDADRTLRLELYFVVTIDCANKCLVTPTLRSKTNEENLVVLVPYGRCGGSPVWMESLRAAGQGRSLAVPVASRPLSQGVVVVQQRVAPVVVVVVVQVCGGLRGRQQLRLVGRRRRQRRVRHDRGLQTRHRRLQVAGRRGARGEQLGAVVRRLLEFTLIYN